MFTKEFKINLVRVMLDPKNKKSVKQLAIENGVDQSTLRHWKDQYLEYGEDGFDAKGRLKSQQDRVKELERELEEAREENEILKKAAAFFAKENLK